MAGGEGDDSKGFLFNRLFLLTLIRKPGLMQEEIFGPVVGFSKANDFDHAIRNCE